MNQKIRLLQICYWIGIILDARAAIRLTLLRYIEIPNVINTVQINSTLYDAIYAVGQDAALMWGWTFLLFWASRKPLERKGVILLTVFPALLGLILNTANVILQYSTLKNEAVNFFGAIVLLVFFGFSYFNATDKKPISVKKDVD